ncbi:MurR/RpiR family transcriptional regulator [Fannyhessea vaginae]|uniref:MurR/RpiR family transcriptional regulator n=1 Tax=Fannyhessea vaginae TaxID=82135 RepID=UPI001F3C348F|nr:MurR/RpiR family transcriptional regulator [Fannyhessea vaginae]
MIPKTSNKTIRSKALSKKITLKNIHSLYDALRLIDPETIEKAVELLQACDRILLFGLGASLIAAKDANLKFLRVNKTCLINDDWHLQLITARNSTSQDVGIVISYSGQTAETLTCAEILKHNNTPIIAITRCIESPISKLADVLLYTTSNESLFRSAAMSSRISQLNIIDILYTAFAVSDYEKNFTYLSKTRIVKHIPKNEREGEHHV